MVAGHDGERGQAEPADRERTAALVQLLRLVVQDGGQARSVAGEYRDY